MPSNVFVNRILNLKKIKYIGLDLDHTLVRYKTENFETLVFGLLQKRLVSDYGYPKDIENFTFHFESAIRGLVVDQRRGNILKLSRFGGIRSSYHGTKAIEFAEQKKTYRSHYVDLSHPDYMPIDTSFSISFCVLYSQLVDLKDENPRGLPSYDQIAKDVSDCIDLLHRDGSLKAIVVADLDKYIVTDSAVVEGLLRFKKHGKKIFVLTNSEYYYAKTLLQYAVDPFLPDGDWSTLFDIVIASSQKPRFFYDNLKFLKISPENGTMTNLEGPIKEGVYQGGNANKFTNDLDVSGDEILYIGDHIYGDILRLKKDCNWRTALVVEELGQEIENQQNAAPVSEKIAQLMKEKEPLEEQVVELLSQKIEAQNDNSNEAISKEISKLQNRSQKLTKKSPITSKSNKPTLTNNGAACFAPEPRKAFSRTRWTASPAFI